MKIQSKVFWKNILKNILNIAAVMTIFCASSIISSFIGDLFSKWFILQTILTTIIHLSLLLIFGSLYGKKVLKMDSSEVGLSFSTVKNLGKKNYFWIAFGLLIPCLVLAIFFLFIPGKFVLNNSAINDSKELLFTLIFALFNTGLSAGIGEEFIMRGLLFRYMKKTLGSVFAVIVPSVIFGLLHITNMHQFNIADVVQLIIGGTSVAIMLTLIAFKTDSLIPGMFFHTCWNILIIGSIFGVGEIVNGQANNALIQYHLSSANQLLTGGNFGIEVSLPAIIVYILVSIFLILPKKTTIQHQ